MRFHVDATIASVPLLRTHCMEQPVAAMRWWEREGPEERMERASLATLSERCGHSPGDAVIRECLRAHDAAQVRADATGVPVQVAINIEVDGQIVTHQVRWVQPLATAGQWTIVKRWDGTETPVRSG